MTITDSRSAARPAGSPREGVPAADVPGATVSWRALSASLWVARREGRHLGTVQRGRRWLASDADSEPIGVFRTFADAQAAVAGSVPRPTAVRGPGLGSVLVAAGLAGGALASAGVWAWATLLG